jgi:ATP-dependent protease Clp ATPase subunit
MWFRTLRCSFCLRKNKDVDKLVAGARGYICDRCARESVRIMDAAPPPAERSAVEHQTVAEPRVVDGRRTWHFATAHD